MSSWRNVAAPDSFGNCVIAKLRKSSSAARIAFISVVAMASMRPSLSCSTVVNCEKNPPVCRTICNSCVCLCGVVAFAVS